MPSILTCFHCCSRSVNNKLSEGVLKGRSQADGTRCAFSTREIIACYLRKDHNPMNI